jgi:uncharacterized membrane protein required for colicin V production
VNILDICVLVLVALCAIAGYKQGLIRTVYRLVSFFIAIFLANMLYPYVAQILRDTPVPVSIQNMVKSGLDIGGYVAENQTYNPSAIIDSMPLPTPLRGYMQAHFAENFQGMMLIETIEDHISAFFANIVVNGIAILIVFFLVLIILSVIGVAIDIVGKLPIIRTFNNAGGLILGLVFGAGIAWLCIFILSVAFASSANAEIYELIETSFIVSRVTELVLPRLAAVG